MPFAFIASDEWKTRYPGASAGILIVRNVSNPDEHPGLETRKVELENGLRARFSSLDRSAVAALPSIQPYSAYYGSFKKTYHVQLQLESVAFKSKPLPRVAALVEAMFMAELKNQLLTAGHDLESIDGSIRLDVAQGLETYTMLNGKDQTLKAGDMYMRDGAGVVSSILYGPDHRTRIQPQTRNVLFAVYAPPGIEPDWVRQHLADIEANLAIFSPQAETALRQVVTAA